MVDWSTVVTSVISGSVPPESVTSGSENPTDIVGLFDVKKWEAILNEIAAPTTTHKTIVINKDYLTRLNEILQMSVIYGSEESTNTIREIRDKYTDTGILTKKDMQIINGLWKILDFQRKFNTDKTSTVGEISKLLGELNDRKE